MAKCFRKCHRTLHQHHVEKLTSAIFNLEWTTPLILDTETYDNACKSEQEVIPAISC